MVHQIECLCRYEFQQFFYSLSHFFNINYTAVLLFVHCSCLHYIYSYLEQLHKDKKIMHKQWVPKLTVSRLTLHRRNRNKAGQKSHSWGSNSNSASLSATNIDARSSATNFSIYVIWKMLFLWDRMLHQWIISSPHCKETLCPPNISISQEYRIIGYTTAKTLQLAVM